MTIRERVAEASPALKFVVTVGIMSFFADFAYEGSRSIVIGVLINGSLGGLVAFCMASELAAIAHLDRAGAHQADWPAARRLSQSLRQPPGDPLTVGREERRMS